MATAEQRGVEAHAQELYELQRPSGAAFWPELPEAERAGWIAAARAESRPRVQVDELNEAASVVYEVAFARGCDEGYGRGTSIAKHEDALDMLEVADRLARNAAKGPSESAGAWLTVTRMALGKTPYANRVRPALQAVDRAYGAALGVIDSQAVAHTIEAIELAKRQVGESLAELRGA